MLGKSGVQRLLGEWARWQASGVAGLENACPLAWVAQGARTSVPCSRPPQGVEMPVAVQVVNAAMRAAELDGYRAQVRVLRAVYLRAEGVSIDQVADVLGLGRKTLAIYRQVGEGYVQAYVSADGRIAA